MEERPSGEANYSSAGEKTLRCFMAPKRSLRRSQKPAADFFASHTNLVHNFTFYF